MFWLFCFFPSAIVSSPVGNQQTDSVVLLLLPLFYFFFLQEKNIIPSCVGCTFWSCLMIRCHVHNTQFPPLFLEITFFLFPFFFFRCEGVSSVSGVNYGPLIDLCMWIPVYYGILAHLSICV